MDQQGGHKFTDLVDPFIVDAATTSHQTREPVFTKVFHNNVTLERRGNIEVTQTVFMEKGRSTLTIVDIYQGKVFFMIDKSLRKKVKRNGIHLTK